MMTSRERIRRIFEFKTPDRVGIKDLFWDETKRSWQHGLEEDLEEYLDFDIRALDIEKEVGEESVRGFFSDRYRDRFRVLSFCEPFQRYVNTVGLERALADIGSDPKKVFSGFKEGLDEVLSRALALLDKGYEVDGLWLFGDLAHSSGLFFSPDFYEKYLFAFHKEICYFFASFGIPTILHSDGNVSRIIPSLLKAGFRGLHPVQYSAGLDIRALKKEYPQDVVFFGNFDIDLARAPKEKVREALVSRLDACKKGGGYIFGFDGPIAPGTNREEYRSILELVKEHGRY